MAINVRRPFLAVMTAVTLAALSPGAGLAQEESEDQLTPNARFMSGKLYLKQQVFDKAESQLRLAVDGDTANAEYRAYWATALAYLGEEKLKQTSTIAEKEERIAAIRATSDIFKAAGEQFANAIRMDPKKQSDWSGDNRAHFWVDIYKQAEVPFKDGRFEDALELYRILTVLNPEEPEGFFRVAYTMDRLGEARQSVILAGETKVMAEQKIAELGDCGQFKSTKAKSECRKKIKELEKIITNVDSFTRSKYADLGYDSFELAQKSGDITAKRLGFDEAQLFFEKALDQDPSLEGVRFSLGNVHFNRARSYEDPPDTAHAYAEYRAAATIFASLADADTVDADTKKDALYNAGSALYAASEWNGALPLLKRYIDLDVKDADTYRRVAKCLSELKEHANAASYFMTFSALDHGESVAVTEAMTTAGNLYPGSDQEKAGSEMGTPDEVRSVLDDQRTVISYFWWHKGEARHFIEGKLVGSVKFMGLTPN